MRSLIWTFLTLVSATGSFGLPVLNPRTPSTFPKTAKFDLVRKSNTANKRDSGTTGEYAYRSDGAYLCEILASGQEFLLQFDSGSSDLWVLGPELEDQVTSQHTFYKPGSSASYVEGSTFVSDYGGNYGVSGTVYVDTVTFGDIAVANQAIGVANQFTGTSDVLQAASFDGIIGLDLGSTTFSSGGATFLENVYEYLDYPVFTTKLTRENEETGFYTFGYINGTVVGEQEIHYTEVAYTEEGYWAFPSTTFSVGDQQISIPDNIAIADTGTTLILVNDNILNAIYGSIGGNCNVEYQGKQWCIYPSDAEVPQLTFSVGNFGFSLADGDLNDGSAAELGYENWNVGTVQSRGEEPADILGDVWLVNVYAIFDFTSGSPLFGAVPRAPGT